MGLPLSNNSEPVSSEAQHTDGSFRKAQRMSKTNHSHVRLSKYQAREFVASLEAVTAGSAGQGRRHGRHDDG